MKDYKLSEIKKICQKYYPTCCTEAGDSNCPLYEGCCFLDKDYPKDWILDEEFHPMTGFYEPPIPNTVESIADKISWDDVKTPAEYCNCKKE